MVRPPPDSDPRTIAVADPTVIIDLSAIAYPNDIPGVRDTRPEWQRVDAAVKAWRQKDAEAVFFGVVDKRTWHRLDAYGQQRLTEWKRRGMARLVSFADPDVLELAEQFSHAVVLTTDLYRDFRRQHPWLQGTTRMIKPVFEPAGVTFVVLNYAPVPDHEVSWRIEEADLKPKGITTPEARQALRDEWACSDSSCIWGAAPVIEDDPAYQDGLVVCPECRIPAKRVGARENTREVVVLLGDGEVDRIPIAEGTTLTIGRGRGDDRYDVRSVLSDSQSTLVSRDHLQISNKAGRLMVEELGSRNGTTLIRSSGDESQLQRGVLQALQPTDRISLARNAMQIRPSGRRRAHGRYAPDLTTAPWQLNEQN